MWIENVSGIDVQNGFHHNAGPNSMLIQIIDIETKWDAPFVPIPKCTFKEINRFDFLDLETGLEFPGADKFLITDEQAKKLFDLLLHAKENCMNVVVHCTAGICRSGAVVEIGSMMGFDGVGNHRIPNILVKQKMMKHLF